MLYLFGDNKAVRRLQSLIIVGNAACHRKAELLIKLKSVEVGSLNVEEHFPNLSTALSVVQYGLKQTTT